MKTIGIIGALENDIVGILHAMNDVKTEMYHNRFFYSGVINKCYAVATSSGMGKVNASMTTQFLIDNYKVDMIINVGIAGSLNSSIHVGDIVISSDAIQHDVDLSIIGCPLGVIPKMRSSIFCADKNLINHVLKCCSEINLNSNTHLGRVASGDQFIADIEKKQYINRNFTAQCVDMEGASIAQTTTINNVPFILIKYISDNADSRASIEYKQKIEPSSLFFEKIINEVFNKL